MIHNAVNYYEEAIAGQSINEEAPRQSREAEISNEAVETRKKPRHNKTKTLRTYVFKSFKNFSRNIKKYFYLTVDITTADTSRQAYPNPPNS